MLYEVQKKKTNFLNFWARTRIIGAINVTKTRTEANMLATLNEIGAINEIDKNEIARVNMAWMTMWVACVVNVDEEC